MPIRPGPELLKVTLNLYAADVEELKRRFGYGYTGQIREIIHGAVSWRTDMADPTQPKLALTLEDLHKGTHDETQD